MDEIEGRLPEWVKRLLELKEQVEKSHDPAEKRERRINDVRG